MSEDVFVQPPLNGAQPLPPLGTSSSPVAANKPSEIPFSNLKSPKAHFIVPLAAAGILLLAENIDGATPKTWQLFLFYCPKFDLERMQLARVEAKCQSHNLPFTNTLHVIARHDIIAA